jgi:predicted deacylase
MTAQTWRLLDNGLTRVSAYEHRATLRVPLNDEPIWVTAQELITPAVYDTWNQNITDHHGISLSELGRSRKNQPIHVFDSNPGAKDVVLLVGRQHPPEVSGAFAFYGFVEVLFDDSDLATAFRQRFRIIAVPLLNPDGVIGGNWRHNLGGVDLNRDWGPFTQPETKLIANLLDDLDNNGSRLRLFIDFHSTNRNLLYTQDDSSATDPPGFARTWLENSAPRLHDYPFTNEARPTSDTANGKNYMYKRYGIPSMTYEVGDETDRNTTRDAAQVFAEEMMQLMLDQGY